MRGLAAYSLTGIFAVLATCAIADVMPSVNATFVVQDDAAVQRVDRSGKGDRLDLNKSVIRKQPLPQPQSRRTVMAGCEPVFSPLAGPADNMAGRCAA